MKNIDETLIMLFEICFYIKTTDFIFVKNICKHIMNHSLKSIKNRLKFIYFNYTGFKANKAKQFQRLFVFQSGKQSNIHY